MKLDTVKGLRCGDTVAEGRVRGQQRDHERSLLPQPAGFGSKVIGT